MRFALTNLIRVNFNHCSSLELIGLGGLLSQPGGKTAGIFLRSRRDCFCLIGIIGCRGFNCSGSNRVFTGRASPVNFSSLSPHSPVSRLIVNSRSYRLIKVREEMDGAKLAKTRIVILDGIPYCSVSSMLKVMEFRDLRKNLTPEYPFGGPQRLAIPEDKVEWSAQWPEYDPPEFTSSSIVKGDMEWMDKDLRFTDVGLWPKWNQQDGGINRRSHHGNYHTDADGYPLNPAGRTGLKGRGNLGRWATNHAADCLITRWKKMDNGFIEEREGRRVLQFIGIIRRDTGDAAFPGGMIDAGEDAMTAVKREFLEEVFNIDEETDEERSRLETALHDVFTTGETVYKGYVDDRRNTDNAWIETEAINFSLSKGDERLFQDLKFKAGSDAKGALWIDVDQNVKLYASHKSIIQILVQKLNAYW